MVHQRPTKPTLSIVRQRTMKQIAIKKHNRTRLNFHRHRIVIRPRKTGRLVRTIKPVVTMPLLEIHHPTAMRTRNHPQTSVLHRRIIHRNPATHQRPISSRNINLILVPRLTGFPRRLDKKHRLHTLHVRTHHLRQNIYKRLMPQTSINQRTNNVRKMDAKYLPQYFFVALIPTQFGHPPNLPPLSSANRQRFATKLINF